jgi:hypothetical protein
LLASESASRKLSPKEAVPSDPHDKIHSSRSAGDKLPNAPKPAFTRPQHLELDLPTEVPLTVTRQKTGLDIGVDTCSGHNQGLLAGQVRRKHLLLEDKTAEAPMPPAAVSRVLQLLARWAVRRARENGKVAQGLSDNGVTADASKG